MIISTIRIYGLALPVCSPIKEMFDPDGERYIAWEQKQNKTFSGLW